MSKRMPLSDFRAVRVVLEPDDFALGSNDPDPPPSDPISQKTWHGILGFSDDVAIRTSDCNGGALGQAYWLRSQWLAAIGQEHDALFGPMLDSADDLQASIFNALHGYYRAGFSALRNVLELTAVGTSGSFLHGSQAYAAWRSGSSEFSFGKACDHLSDEPMLNEFNAHLRGSVGQSLFDAKDKKAGRDGGYARQWYTALCGYAHSRPGLTDGDLWESNGPIYVEKVFRDWFCAYSRTISICSVLILLCCPSDDRKRAMKLFTDDDTVVPAEVRRAFVLASTPYTNGSLGT
jgi:hypothetical protein